MYYNEKLNYVYPQRSDEHMIEVKKLRDTNFDEKYPYLPKGFWHKVQRIFMFLVVHCLAVPACTIRHGVRVFGRKKLKQNKELLKDGAITIANHVFMWDYLCVLKAIRPRLQYHPAWKTNFEGPNGPLIRFVGGIPVPTGNIRAMAKFANAIDTVLKEKKWLHFFPEGSMWFYYPDIRPLKPAVFRFAVKHNKPVIPITLSFRKRKGFWRIFSKNPFVDVNIGDPILPDTSLSSKEAVDKLHKEAYHIMQVMNGINPGDPTYNTNQNIETYIKTR